MVHIATTRFYLCICVDVFVGNYSGGYILNAPASTNVSSKFAFRSFDSSLKKTIHIHKLNILELIILAYVYYTYPYVAIFYGQVYSGKCFFKIMDFIVVILSS